MSEQTQAAPSPAEVTDVFNGENVSFDEFHKYRQSGELPERFKTAETVDSTTTDNPEETEPSEVEETESAGDPETPKDPQEQKGKGAEQRIKQLLAEKKRLQSELEEVRRPKQQTQAESSPAKPAAPQTYQEWRTGFKPAEWIQDYAKSNPEATYEEANAAMADFLGDARDHFKGVEQKRQAIANNVNAKVAEARDRYENFDDVIKPFVSEFVSDQAISPTVKSMIDDSEVFADLMFTLAGDTKFLAMAKDEPGKAIRYIAKVEGLIQEELAKGSESERNEKGQFASKDTPAKQKTSAPPPPKPVNGASSRAFDVSDESLSPEEWMRKRTDDLKRRKS